jgi:hypothetical protein
MELVRGHRSIMTARRHSAANMPKARRSHSRSRQFYSRTALADSRKIMSATALRQKPEEANSCEALRQYV